MRFLQVFTVHRNKFTKRVIYEKENVALKRAGFKGSCLGQVNLSTESVKGSALSLESVDDVESSDGLSLGVLGVGDGVTDDVLEEDLEDAAGLFVDEAGDSLDATSSSKSSDRGLGDALDVVSHDLAVTLGAALSKTLSSFSSTRHFSLNLTLSE